MRKRLTANLILLVAMSTIAFHTAQAATRQIVVIVAEGLSPQVIELGSNYIKYPPEDGNTPAFDTLTAQGKAQGTGAFTMDALKGILKRAAANGYKTGLVTTDDVTAVAPVLYDAPAGDGAATALIDNTKFDFLAGGGRQSFTPAVIEGFHKAGNTTILDVDTLQATGQDATGRVLALQSNTALPYALDREAGESGGLSDLAALAVETLAKNDAPFMLVIHDSLLAKALETKDTPAVAGEFRELDSIINNILTARDDHPNLGLALLATGSATIPHLAGATANDRSNTFFLLSQLPVSFTKAGAQLQGANEEKLTDFMNESYKDWKLTPDNRAAILGGTIAPEAAIRASYEPALQVNYEQAAAQPMAYTLGLDNPGDLLQTLNDLANNKPG